MSIKKQELIRRVCQEQAIERFERSRKLEGSTPPANMKDPDYIRLPSTAGGEASLFVAEWGVPVGWYG
jgi:hypothetical protein